MDQHFGAIKLFGPKVFLTPDFFLIQTLFGSKIFFNQNFCEPKFYLTQILFRAKFLGPLIVLDCWPKIIWTQNYFGPKIILDLQFFWKIFWTIIFFGLLILFWPTYKQDIINNKKQTKIIQIKFRCCKMKKKKKID